MAEGGARKVSCRRWIRETVGVVASEKKRGKGEGLHRVVGERAMREIG